MMIKCIKIIVVLMSLILMNGCIKMLANPSYSFRHNPSKIIPHGNKSDYMYYVKTKKSWVTLLHSGILGVPKPHRKNIEVEIINKGVDFHVGYIDENNYNSTVLVPSGTSRLLEISSPNAGFSVNARRDTPVELIVTFKNLSNGLKKNQLIENFSDSM